ncbi:GAF and ANTAR domain-containing protein [Actinacidiphila acidipaludis]|uniref:GAF and ANTAR domain-containing protein n=1 Tax=Actinacidiphila acidipaludis TaxID=2873382 RepID=A0ABS7QB86_9ACTN|nr:GAF and ANTAR domain-containing protein [Streptomyces acidipaludis]MBY8879705.1 GAF and ANTAR domain-containing protein [Streptomyces acidipaludis]
MEPGRPGGGGGRPSDRLDPEDRKRFGRALAEAVAGADPVAVPELLCRACVEILDVTGASVSLSDGAAGILWWSSDETAGRLAETQYSLGDGPCRRAIELVAPVMASDLSAAPDAERWPVFAERAVELGVRAVFSLPLGTDAVAVGTLDLYRREPGPLSGRDQALAFPASDAITYALTRVESAAAEDDDGFASWLDAAEDDREEINRATGMVMVQLGVDAQHALARLRAYAFAEGRTVSDVALGVLAGEVRFDD